MRTRPPCAVHARVLTDPVVLLRALRLEQGTGHQCAGPGVHDDPARRQNAMQGMSYPAALLENTQAKGYGRIWRVPLTFVVDRRGTLRRDGFAAAPILDAAALDHDVLPLLREP